LVETSDHLVRRVGDLFDHHERDERVDLGRQDRVEEVRVGSEGYSDVGLQGREWDVAGKVND
jgi:hypothetical protein